MFFPILSTLSLSLTNYTKKKEKCHYILQILEKNINQIYNSNSKFCYGVLPYIKAKNANIPIIDYVHMEEWYNRNGGYSRYSTMYESVIDKTLTCNENSRREQFSRLNDGIRIKDVIKMIFISKFLKIF